MSYGCKVNTYDSGLLQQRMNREGFELCEKSPDVILMNTCAVTHEATKESLRHLRKIKRENPGVKVVMTGCAAQVDSPLLLESSADMVVANSHKTVLQEKVKDLLNGKPTDRLYRSNIFKKEELEPGGGLEQEHTRSFVKIQDGCNSFCTFCVIPFARGKSRSLTINNIVERVNELHASGVSEVVLTGVHIGDYEDKSQGELQGLEGLVQQVLLKTKVPRLRLTSLEPIELSDELLRLYKDNPRLCRHFHMSIQSANTKILSSMKRKYSSDHVAQALNNIEQNVPGAFVGMDVIVGFPGETPEDFQQTFELLKALPWTQIHVFPYSPRPGIYANRLPDQWQRSEIMERAKILRALSQERFEHKAKEQVGTKKSVLLLKKKSVVQSGLSEDYWNIHLEHPTHLLPGQLVEVLVKSYEKDPLSPAVGRLVGEIIC